MIFKENKENYECLMLRGSDYVNGVIRDIKSDF